jgi:toxin ParE1/3/4
LTLVWLPEATFERVRQLDYIAQDNPLAAVDQDGEVERQVDTLQVHPKLGRSGRVKGTRELVISHTPFIVAYRLKGQRIEVIRFLNGAQRWPEEL